MRLGQLARKLAIRPVEIVGFLAKHNIQLDEDANTKLEDDQVSLVLQHYGLPQEDAFAPEAAKDEITVQESISQADEEIIAQEPEPSQEQSQEVELIKAQKIELAGLKVLGKIELPELKKKAPTEDLPSEKENAEVETPPREVRKSNFQKRGAAPRKNPIALQREREEREAEEKRKAQILLEKEKRAQHYLKKVKTAPLTKRVRLVDEPMEEFPQEALVEAPKTWWGRFMRWLNT